MKTPISKPSAEINSLTRAVHQLCDRVAELQILDSVSTKVQHTSGGVVIEVKKTADGTSASAKSVWRP